MRQTPKAGFDRIYAKYFETFILVSIIVHLQIPFLKQNVVVFANILKEFGQIELAHHILCANSLRNLLTSTNCHQVRETSFFRGVEINKKAAKSECGIILKRMQSPLTPPPIEQMGERKESTSITCVHTNDAIFCQCVTKVKQILVYTNHR